MSSIKLNHPNGTYDINISIIETGHILIVMSKSIDSIDIVISPELDCVSSRMKPSSNARDSYYTSNDEVIETIVTHE